MRRLIYLIIVFNLAFDGAVIAQDYDLYEENPLLSSPKAQIMNEPLLADILALGKKEELMKLPSYKNLKNVRFPLAVNLYEIPGDEGYCLPESHAVCTSQYFMAVHNFELPIQTAAFALGTFGKLTNFEWNEPEKDEQAHLYFEAYRYPEWAIEENKDLAEGQQRQKYEMWVSTSSISIKPIQ